MSRYVSAYGIVTLTPEVMRNVHYIQYVSRCDLYWAIDRYIEALVESGLPVGDA